MSGTLQVGGTAALPSTSDVTDNGTLDLNGIKRRHRARQAAAARYPVVPPAPSRSRSAATAAAAPSRRHQRQRHGRTGVFGTGTEIITGTSNTYSGATTITSGTLEVDGVINSSVAVNGTGMLTGPARFLGVTVTNGCAGPHLSTADVTLQHGSAFDATIGGNTPGARAGYSQDIDRFRVRDDRHRSRAEPGLCRLHPASQRRVRHRRQQRRQRHQRHLRGRARASTWQRGRLWSEGHPEHHPGQRPVR